MKTGIVSDPIYLTHETGSHPENKERLVAIHDLLKKSGGLDHLTVLSPRMATAGELLAVHSQELVETIESVVGSGGGWLDADTVVSPGSYKAALYAAGGVIRATDAVLMGEVDSAFALVRPPGHHATPDRSMGFCLFNNVAVAARYARQWHALERVLIADFDVHHGNGTQDVFYEDANVLYFSTHQYPYYPGSGAAEEIGRGAGRGTTVNVPLPAGCGDEAYRRVYSEILVPVSRRFRPQLILVSAGYDAHWADQLAMMQLSVSGLAAITGIIRDLAAELCEGKLVLALEGGYNLEALSHSVKATFETLLGSDVVQDPLGGPRSGGHSPGIDDILKRVKKIHQLG